MRVLVAFAATLAALGAARAQAAGRPGAEGGPVDYASQIQPIFVRACVSCHGPGKANGGLQLTSARGLAKGGIGDDLLVPGQGRASYLVRRLRGEGGEERMPLEAPALAPAEIALVERWIDEGAKLPVSGPERYVPAPGGVKRLTAAQYHNTLRDLFGPDLPLPRHLEPDTLVAGSAAVGAARVGLSPYGVEKFARAAFAVAHWAVGDPGFQSRFVPCSVNAPFAEACARAFLEGFGLRAWRRPLAPGEVGRYLELVRAGARPALAAGLADAIAALLQSPSFLYRSELGTPDPAHPGLHRLTDFELASRLSYFLWGAPPDEALLAAAAAGKLATDAGLEAESRRLLASPRARASMSAFFVELFRLRRLDRISESRTRYKQYSPTLGASLRGETLRLIEEVAFDPRRDFREIFSTPVTFLNPELARLYQLPPPAAAGAKGAAPRPDAEGYWRVELPPEAGRGGVLGQGSFLTIFAHATTSSPTKRGKFVREALLCQAVPPPPPDVETRLPREEGRPTRTTRQKLEAHRRDPRCTGCHKAMDPLGLAFEGFDGIGAARPDEGGLPIDTSGELDGVPFRTPAELGRLLARSPKVGACVARSLFRFALGHLESEGEEPLLEQLARGLERDGYSFPTLVANVIKSDGFRLVSAPAAGPTSALHPGAR